MKYKISVVIPNYNGQDLLNKNLPEIISKSKSYDPKIELIVVDDGSTDGSVSYLRNNYPEVKTVKIMKNQGFSHAVNSGIKASKGDLVVLLNNDVIPKENYLKRSIEYFNDEKVFAVSFHELGFGWAKGYFKDGFIGHVGTGETKLSHISFWANGGSAIFRKKYLMELESFDEELFSPFYWEDIDLGYRAWKRGYKVLWEPNSLVLHHHESTISKIPVWKKNLVKERNQLLFIWKNITSENLFRKHLQGLSKRLLKHPGYIKIVFLALLKFRICVKKRKIERREASVSDEIIFSNFSG